MNAQGSGKKSFAGLWKKTLLPALFFPMICGCASSGTKTEIVRFLPPEILLTDIKIPSRREIRTVGDMAKTLVEDERVMRLKNADLEALREYRNRLEARK